jgi:plasmid stabilization system protein ParE
VKSRIISIAEAELTLSAEYYENAAQGIGEAFLDLIVTAIRKIEQTPTLGRPIVDGCFKFTILTFPCDIIYEIFPDEIVIYAFAHQSRQPEYWIERL